MVTRIKNAWGMLNPRWRMTIRTLVIGLLVYLFSDLSDGDIDDWEKLGQSALISVSYAVLGLLTPLEPFVGIGKPAVVDVPPPPPPVTQ